MARKCSTCQHPKRAEIDRRLAGGEPGNQIATDYHLNPSSLHRHRINCLKLSSSNDIMKETARGTAALAAMPTKEELYGSFADLHSRINSIAAQAEQQGSLKIALSGLNLVRQMLMNLSRLSGLDQAQTSVAVQTDGGLDVTQLAARLIERFDSEPELKARIARAILELDDEKVA